MSAPLTLSERDGRFLLPHYTNLSKRAQGGALVVTGGERVFIDTADGRRLLDGMSGMWAASLGFHHPGPIAAARQQLDTLPFYHYGLNMSHEPAIQLAEKLASLVPLKHARIHFATTGSEANDFLVKFVWYVNNARGRPRKKKIISRVNSWHGSTIAAGSMSGITRARQGFDLPIDRFLYTDEPHFYRCALAGENELDFCRRLAQNLDSLIEREGPDTVAAFIAEPVTGASGVVVPPDAYYPLIQEVLRRHDVLFLADEVITGFGRTGRMFGSETCGIRPDTMTFAKGFSAAYAPISALAVNEDFYHGLVQGSDQIGFFAHGTTFAGHPVGAAVALKVIEIIERDGLIDNVRRMGDRLGKGLRALAARPYVGEVRGIGLMWAIELVADKESRRMLNKTGAAGNEFALAAERAGLIVRNVAKGDAIAVAPPLIINAEEVDELLLRLERALDETIEYIEKRGLQS